MTSEVSIRPWKYSVKLDVNAKGFVQPSVHVNSDTEDRDLWLKAVTLLQDTIDELKVCNYKIATDLANQRIEKQIEDG